MWTTSQINQVRKERRCVTWTVRPNVTCSLIVSWSAFLHAESCASNKTSFPRRFHVRLELPEISLGELYYSILLRALICPFPLPTIYQTKLSNRYHSWASTNGTYGSTGWEKENSTHKVEHQSDSRSTPLGSETNLWKVSTTVTFGFMIGMTETDTLGFSTLVAVKECVFREQILYITKEI